MPLEDPNPTDPIEPTEPEEPKYLSKRTLRNLNVRIRTILREYLTSGIDIRFDMPDPEEPPTNPTVSVFLYDIQEDLQLRHGEGRKFDPMTGSLKPGWVHVRCCYLLTYWEPISKSSDGPRTGVDSGTLTTMNEVLNALINTREVLEIPGSYTRVIPPSEQLNSLGNFWQSLGNKPRLCLSYSVTIPIELTSKEEDSQTPILQIEDPVVEQSPGDLYEEAAQALWNILYTQLRAASTRNEAIRLQLAKVLIKCVPAAVEEGEEGDDREDTRIEVHLSGVATEELVGEINAIADGWISSTDPACVVKGIDLYVEAVDSEELAHVSARERAKEISGQ